MTGLHRATAAVALVGAGLAAFVLHTSVERTQVAQVVPVALAWGAAVFAMARDAPGHRHVVVAATLVRLLVVGVPAVLSDDLFRYLWEGHALLAGHQPLYDAPLAVMAADPDLVPALGARVNHPDLPSVYPPLAMAWFAMLARLGGTVASAQLAAVVADVVTVAALHRLAPRGAWLYALLPLPVLESAAGAHIDVPAVTLALLGVLAVRVRREGLGFGLLLAGALTKLFPLVLLPTAWLALPGRSRWTVPAVGGAAGLLLALPFLRAELPPGLVAYGTHWSFNGLLFLPLQTMLPEQARPLSVAAGALIGSLVALRVRDLLVAWAVMGVAFVALTPTMHPWYLLWALVPSLALGRREAAAAAVFVPASYAVFATWDEATGSWEAGWWLWSATWVPALSAAALVGWWDSRTIATSEAP